MERITPTRSPRASWDSDQPTVVNRVLPCYDEPAVLRETGSRLGALLNGLKDAGRVAQDSAAYCVDDGSRQP